MPLSHSRAVVALLGAAALFSTGGAAIKAVDFDGWEIASLRAGIAAVTLVLLSRDARRGWRARTLLHFHSIGESTVRAAAEPASSG
jgi:drug/metabolite transporter (DMT)-like permease